MVGKKTKMLEAINESLALLRDNDIKKAMSKLEALTKPKAKRPPSAYNNFIKENIKAAKSIHPDKTYKELMVIVSGWWKEKGSSMNNNETSETTIATRDDENFTTEFI